MCDRKLIVSHDSISLGRQSKPQGTRSIPQILRLARLRGSKQALALRRLSLRAIDDSNTRLASKGRLPGRSQVSQQL